MTVKYSTFKKLFGLYLNTYPNVYDNGLYKELSRLIHMAGYLDDVDTEAHKITEAIEDFREMGLAFGL